MHHSPLVSMRHASRVGLALALAAAGILSCERFTNVVARDGFDSDLNGGKVRPTAVQTSGRGRLNIVLTSDTTTLTYRLEFSDLSSAATAAHIHGAASDTGVAPILVNFSALPAGGQGTIQLGTSGSASGSIDLRLAVETKVAGAEFFRLLHVGQLYVDVHTVTNADGEIRGQISP